MAMRQTNRQSDTYQMNETRRQVGTSSQEYQHKNSVQVAQRNYLSYSEFPDVTSSVSDKNPNRSDKILSENCKIQGHSAKKIAKFKPFDPNTAPANFKKCNKDLNGQDVENQNYYRYQQPQQQQQQHLNHNMTGGQQFYSGQGQPIYQYIHPREFSQPCMYSQISTPSGPSARAVAPNGEKIFIPLDDSRYEIKRSDHDLYDMPENCNLHILSSEGQFESSVQMHSPRPICVRGSLSDEWSCSSQEGPFTDSESERETDIDTGTDTSEIATPFVTDVLEAITESIDNVFIQSNNDDLRKMEQEQPKPLPQEVNNNGVSPRKESARNECEENNKELETNNKCDKNKTDLKKIDSSSSESDITKTSKRAKVEIKSKYFYAKNHEADQVLKDARNIKKSKDSRPRAWKENRKEKRGRNVSRGNKERKAASSNECSASVNETKPETQHSVDAHALNIGQHFGNSSSQPMFEENVIIDGQYYFQSQQYCNGQYQHYYMPNTINPDGYQQYQYTDKPEYTMFIHDACPPPSKDEVCEQVHKSLSGEVINNQAAAYQQQVIDSSLCQQPNVEQFVQTPCNNITGGNTEELYCNAEQLYCNPEQTYSNTDGVVVIDQGTCDGATNALSSNMWIGNQAQSTIQNVASCNISNAKDQQSNAHGQIYISYEEDSVYVDPDSGLSFPALHMTDDLLVTVILREGVFIEITANKDLRLVNHEKKLVVAINGPGNKACVIHPAARIYQSDTSVHADLYLGRRAKMTEEMIMFGNKSKTYKFDNRMVTDMTEEPIFRDMSHDDSVSFLSTNGATATNSDEMKQKMEEILAHAHFWKNGTCGSTTIINGTKIVQNEKGDVSVYSGPINFLRMNPKKTILRVKTRFIEVDIETNWNVKITRGSHALNASHMGFILCNGKIKASLDSNNNLQSFSMPDYRVLMLGQPVSKHRPGVPGQRGRTPTRNEEPEGDHWGYIRHNMHDDQNCFREWEEGWDYDFNKNCKKRWDPLAGRWVYPTQTQW